MKRESLFLCVLISCFFDTLQAKSLWGDSTVQSFQGGDSTTLEMTPLVFSDEPYDRETTDDSTYENSTLENNLACEDLSQTLNGKGVLELALSGIKSQLPKGWDLTYQKFNYDYPANIDSGVIFNRMKVPVIHFHKEFTLAPYSQEQLTFKCTTEEEREDITKSVEFEDYLRKNMHEGLFLDFIKLIKLKSFKVAFEEKLDEMDAATLAFISDMKSDGSLKHLFERISSKYSETELFNKLRFLVRTNFKLNVVVGHEKEL